LDQERFARLRIDPIPYIAELILYCQPSLQLPCTVHVFPDLAPGPGVDNGVTVRIIAARKGDESVGIEPTVERYVHPGRHCLALAYVPVRPGSTKNAHVHAHFGQINGLAIARDRVVQQVHLDLAGSVVGIVAEVGCSDHERRTVGGYHIPLAKDLDPASPVVCGIIVRRSTVNTTPVERCVPCRREFQQHLYRIIRLIDQAPLLFRLLTISGSCEIQRMVTETDAIENSHHPDHVVIARVCRPDSCLQRVVRVALHTHKSNVAVGCVLRLH